MPQRYVSSTSDQLFEAFGVIRAAAHPIKILRDERMIGLRQRKPIDWLIAIVTRVGAYRQTNMMSQWRFRTVPHSEYSQR